MKSLKGKSILRIKDLTPTELSYLIEEGLNFKKNKKISSKNIGKKAVCFFSKSSSRTKSAWEVGCYELGIGSSYNDASSSQLGKKESIKDSANVFSQFYDIIGWRCMKYEDIEELSKNAKIPCVNLLCNKNHPTQAICDLMTIKEKFGKINGIKVAFVGACNNNVARSLIEGLLMLGGSYIGIGPKKIWPSNNELIEYKKIANENNGSIEFVEDVNKLKNVDVIYQDVFLDLGESEDLWPERLELYKNYQVDMKKIKYANKDFIYMHCLPAINGSASEYAQYVSKNYGKKFPFVSNGEVEVTNDVFSSKNSVVFKQAQNRLYAMKAIIKSIIK